MGLELLLSIGLLLVWVALLQPTTGANEHRSRGRSRGFRPPEGLRPAVANTASDALERP